MAVVAPRLRAVLSPICPVAAVALLATPRPRVPGRWRQLEEHRRHTGPSNSLAPPGTVPAQAQVAAPPRRARIGSLPLTNRPRVAIAVAAPPPRATTLVAPPRAPSRAMRSGAVAPPRVVRPARGAPRTVTLARTSHLQAVAVSLRSGGFSHAKVASLKSMHGKGVKTSFGTDCYGSSR